MSHNGPMGYPADDRFPQWAIDIIDFRNQEYSNDIQNISVTFNDVDQAYKKISNAIGEMCDFIFENIDKVK